MTESEIKAREMKNIKEFCLMDDTFFGAVFDGELMRRKFLSTQYWGGMT